MKPATDESLEKVFAYTFVSLLALTSASAFAAPIQAHELKSKYESSFKDGQTKVDHSNSSETAKDLSALSGGQVSASEMNTALAHKFSVVKGGQTIQTSVLAQAQALRDAKTVTNSINRNDLDAGGKALMAQKERALVLLPKFLASASIVTADLTGSNNLVTAFHKELAEVKDMVSTMTASELSGHLDVIEKAVQIRQGNRELSGDQAFAQALQQKYGDKFNQKIAELVSCE